QLKADIPSQNFHVRPVAGTDLSQVKTLAWSAATSRLNALKIDLDMKNTTGGINARLDAPAELFDGKNKIALTVKGGDATVTTSARSVAAASEVVAGARKTLSIEPVTGGAAPEAGNYTGTVSVVFEPAA